MSRINEYGAPGEEPVIPYRFFLEENSGHSYCTTRAGNGKQTMGIPPNNVIVPIREDHDHKKWDGNECGNNQM